MTGSYHSSMFTFLRTLHAVLLSGYIILHSSPAVQEGALFSTPCPAFIVCTFFYNGHLTGMRGYLTVVLICIFLIISNVECLFICSLALCMERLAVGNLKALGENSEITERVSKSSKSHPEI